MAPGFKIVHTDATPEQPLDVEMAQLEGLEVDLIRMRGAGPSELRETVREADIILTSGALLDRALVESLTRCRGIVRYGVGVDNIDIEAATERGIVVANVQDYCTEEVANHALMFILACARRLRELDATTRRTGWHTWTALPQPLHGETLGIIGLGRIGRALSLRAQALRMRVLAYDPYVDEEEMTAHGAEKVELDRLLRESDYVSLHAELTAETRGMIGERELAIMKPRAFLINTARGPEIDEAALVEALRSRRIAGAAVDVYDQEPLPASSPLLSLENLWVTPHLAFFSLPSVQIMRTEVGRAAAALLKGRRPKYVINPAVADRVGLLPSEEP